MREIKFRAWIKANKRMELCIGVNPFYVSDCDRLHWKHDEVELMQFTGLKDKNGKEIYEGDLIEVKTEKYHFISEIMWDETSASFEFQDTQNTYCGLDAINVFEHGSSLYGGFVEVIGNIHENLELLNQLTTDSSPNPI